MRKLFVIDVDSNGIYWSIKIKKVNKLLNRGKVPFFISVLPKDKCVDENASEITMMRDNSINFPKVSTQKAAIGIIK